jgi:carbamoyltransferase
MGTEIETLAIGNCFLRKEDQNPELRIGTQSAFEPD